MRHDRATEQRPVASDSHILTSMLNVDTLALEPEDRDGTEAGEAVEIEFVS